MVPAPVPPAEGVTAKVDGVVLMHGPTATTVTLPAVALGVAEIVLVVELPVQPPGNVQVYEVAPATVATVYVVATP